jgi:hypothetical protein
MSEKWQGATCPLLDDLFRASEERRWDFDIERSRRLEIDDKLVLGRLLRGGLSGFGGLQNPIDIVSPKPVDVRNTWPVDKQSTRFGKAAQ